MSLTRNSSYGMGRKRRRKRGRGLGDFLRSAHDFIKKHKIISSVGSALGAVGVPYAGLVGKAAGVLGYGRRRTRRTYKRRKRGGDLKSTLTNIHKFVKDKRLVSSALRHFLPHSNLHKVAHIAGYGRRHGGANFFTESQIAAPKFS